MVNIVGVTEVHSESLVLFVAIMIFWGLAIALLTSKLWLGESIRVENPTYVCISFVSG